MMTKIDQTPTWRPHPTITDYQFDILTTDEMLAKKEAHGWVEDFGHACYPTAINAVTGNRERGGAYMDRVAAMQWVERVAGLHPVRPDDEWPPFYY